MKYLFLLLPEILVFTTEMTWAWNCIERTSADRPTLNSAVLAQFSIFFQLTLHKHLCPPLSSLGLIIVTRSSQAALNLFLKKTAKGPNSAARLVQLALKWDHVSPLLRTLHWLPIQARIEYKLSTLCHSFFALIQPLFICLTFSVSTLHQDSSAPHLSQELYAFRR